MPWVPELFSAPALQAILDQRRRDALVAVPYFDGLLAGDPDPLIESFAHEPEVYDPLRGRVKGVRAFTAFVIETSQWLREHHARVDDVEHVILDRRGFEEVVLHLDTDHGMVSVPVAVVAERGPEGRIGEVRVYFDGQPLTGRHEGRPPILQPDPALTVPPAIAAYLRGLATADVEAVVLAFEPDGYVRGSVGHVDEHRGPEAVRVFHRRLFSRDQGVSWDACSLVDDGRVGALEYDVVPPGATPRSPQAGIAVFARGRSGRLAAVRVYDSVDPSQPSDL